MQRMKQKEALLFDFKIERTTRRNNSKTRKQKQQAKLQQQHQQMDNFNSYIDFHTQSTIMAERI